MRFFRSNPQTPETGGPGAAESSVGLDAKEMLARFRRRLPLFGVVTAGVFLAAAVMSWQAKPVYTATASLMIEPRKQEVLKVNSVVSQLPPESSVVDTETKLLNSRSLAERVVRKLNLDKDSEFAGGGRTLTAAFGGGGVRSQPAPEAVVDDVLNRLNARRVGLTYVIDVNFTSGDPQKAAKIANAFAQEYLDQQTLLKQQATMDANTWLSAKLDQMREQAEAADAQVQYYKIANGLMSAEGATMAEQEISVLNQQIAIAQADLAEKQGRLAAARGQLRRGGGGADTAAALGSETVRSLRAQRAEVSRRKAELESRYGPQHPDMIRANQELADYDRQVDQEIRRILSNLEAEVQVAQQRTASLMGSRGQARGTLASNGRAMVGLMELERKAEAERAVYEAFLNRSKETAAQAGINSPDARVVSRAQPPTRPSAPNHQLNLALGLAFALTAGLAAVVAAETLDGGLRTSRDVSKRLGMSTLGNVPMLATVAPQVDRGNLKPEDYLVQRPKSAFAEAFRNLRTSLLFARPGEEVKVVAVTSAMPEEGKTLTTLCLGRLSAMGGSRVVIVDCDLRHRSLSQRFESGPQGLFEVLKGQARLEDVMRHDKPSGAWILPIAEGSWSDPEVFRSPPMERLLERLRADFDLVLLDTPPVLAVSDTRVLATVADVTLYLLRWAKTPEMAARNALEQLESAGAYVPGVALTQVDMNAQKASGYGDTAYYYDSFKKYYQG